VFSEEFGRTPVRLTPGCPEIGQGPQTSFSAKCLWQFLQRLREPIYTEWPKLQLPCHRARYVRKPRAILKRWGAPPAPRLDDEAQAQSTASCARMGPET